MEIIGENISLLPYTMDRCHEFWKDYIVDYNMWDEEFVYDKNWVDKYYNFKVRDKTRRYFAICINDKVIGEIQLKNINDQKGIATLGIHFSNDNYKNQGFGTEAIELMICYSFEHLKLNTLYADAVLRNKRSEHVLEKLGFVEIRADEILRYYELKRFS